ncbi:MAG: hypothetical protein KC413_09020, partial [Anaerolineales bacterium]|nr:hypothetical protein [Anaerolineales bacterium]
MARKTILLVLLLLLASGCSLLAGPQQPVIPSPPPLYTPVTLGEIPADTVVDPVSSVTPGVDPEIAALAE